MADASAPVPVVRVAAGVRTLLLFDAEIDKESLELDASRVRLVDAGARSLILQPLTEPGAEERWGLRVRFRDGAEPREAFLVLASHPSEVDTQVDVTRHAKSLAACEAALSETQARCGAGGLAELVVSGALDARGIFTSDLTAKRMDDDRPVRGWIHLGPGWVLIAVRLLPPPGQRTWVFQAARLAHISGQPWYTARAVRVKPTTAEGEELVVVEFASPEPPASGLYTLSLSEVPGARSLMDLKIRIPSTPPLHTPEHRR